MTETETQPRETKAQRREREAAEQQAREQETATLAYLATLDPTSPDLSDEERYAFDNLTEKQAAEVMKLRAAAAEAKLAEAVGDFGTALTETGDLRAQTQPVRNRKPVQQAMDKVAAKAYTDWVAAGRPTTWQRMPVITYFIDPGTEDGDGSLADYRRWIRAAVSIVPAEPYEKDGKKIEPNGVRARFGSEFVLSEAMAQKIGKPEHAGKTVLAWAAIDKRNVSDKSNGNTE